MDATSKLNMLLDDFCPIIDGFDNAIEIHATFDGVDYERVELVTGSGGFHFDTSFGNYLPDDPTTDMFYVYPYANVNLTSGKDIIAQGEFEIPEDWYYDYMDWVYDGEDTDLTTDKITDQLTESIEEKIWDDVSDPAVALAMYYDDSEEVDPYLGKGLTLRDFLLRSALVTPVG